MFHPGCFSRSRSNLPRTFKSHRAIFLQSFTYLCKVQPPPLESPHVQMHTLHTSSEALLLSGLCPQKPPSRLLSFSFLLHFKIFLKKLFYFKLSYFLHPCSNFSKYRQLFFFQLPHQDMPSRSSLNSSCPHRVLITQHGTRAPPPQIIPTYPGFPPGHPVRLTATFPREMKIHQLGSTQ